MDRAEILAFLNRNQMCHLATVEGDKPHVRGLMMYRADEHGILFHTGSMKDLTIQLRANPQVEICFNNLQENLQVRVSGTAVFVEDQTFKEEIVSAREFLKPWVQEQGYDMLTVFRVKDSIATVWTFEKNFEPKKWIRL